jgi:hypothetical protein
MKVARLIACVGATAGAGHLCTGRDTTWRYVVLLQLMLLYIEHVYEGL